MWYAWLSEKMVPQQVTLWPLRCKTVISNVFLIVRPVWGPFLCWLYLVPSLRGRFMKLKYASLMKSNVWIKSHEEICLVAQQLFEHLLYMHHYRQCSTWDHKMKFLSLRFRIHLTDVNSWGLSQTCLKWCDGHVECRLVGFGGKALHCNHCCLWPNLYPAQSFFLLHMLKSALQTCRRSSHVIERIRDAKLLAITKLQVLLIWTICFYVCNMEGIFLLSLIFEVN